LDRRSGGGRELRVRSNSEERRSWDRGEGDDVMPRLGSKAGSRGRTECEKRKGEKLPSAGTGASISTIRGDREKKNLKRLN